MKHAPRPTLGNASRSVAAAFALLIVPGFGPSPAASEEAAPPKEVMQAIAAAAPGTPAEVVVGAYINDIQELDFKANNYAVDLYVWFRWKDAGRDPSATMEFMNRYASDDNVREALYDKPERMPDGSFYSILRYQGRFATKFPLEAYPLDTQTLKVVMEDTVSGAPEQIYVPDGPRPVTLDPVVTLPGFKVGTPSLKVIHNTYPTNFGDLSVSKAETYSRIVLTIPVTRRVVAMSLKTFVPIALIVVCASLVFFVRPRYVEGRIGLGITALLTLVALQLTSGASLPDVDYLMMLDKIYLLAYLFIILALARVVATSWRAEDAEKEGDTWRMDRTLVVVLLAAYLAANGLVVWTTFA